MKSKQDIQAIHFRKLERMYQNAPCNEYFKPKLTIRSGETDLEIPVRADFFHVAGAVHGSVYFKAMDDACFFAVQSQVRDVLVLTSSFTVYFTRPVVEGVLRSVAKVVSHSRQLIIAEAEVYDSRHRVVGRGSGTFMKSSLTLTKDIGYA